MAIDQKLQTAIQWQQNNQPDKAEQAYLDILQENPNHIDALQLLGILYGQLGNYNQSESYLRRAIHCKSSASLYTNLANVLAAKGQYKQAIACCDQALALDPTNAVALNNRGVLYYKLHRFNEAKADYANALHYRSNYADPHYNRALIFLQEGNKLQAKNDLDAALQFDAQHTGALNQLGQILHEEGHLSDAITHYQRSLAIDDKEAHIHHKLAVALVNQGELNQAIEHFLIALKLDPSHADAHQHLGLVYLSQRQYPQALRQFMAQINLNPTAEAYFNLATVYMHQDYHREAINYFQQVLTLNKKHLDTWINLGAIYLKKGDYDKAAQHYQQALALDPKNPELTYILAAINKKSSHLFTQSPAAYVENLFDNYAPHFDQHLTKVLHYKAPELLHKAVTDCLETTSDIQSPDEAMTIVDIGCGTGLCGPLFKPLAKQLWGIDLSPKMLEKAAEKSVYDTLICADIIETLQKPEHKQRFNLVLAADVLPYFGELAPLFEAVAQCMQHQGYFVFTTEKTTANSTAAYTLERSARFSHANTTITHLAERAGFTILKQTSVQTRLQHNTPVKSELYILTLC